MNDYNAIRHIVSNYFQAYPEVVAVYLHGSVAKGHARPDSDIDIGLMLQGKEWDKLMILHKSSDLELELKKRVDIGIISSDNLVYSREAILNGVCIFSSNNFCRQMKETTILSLYVKLQNERKEILNAYTA